jgi:parallel beta-helix repeat protein
MVRASIVICTRRRVLLGLALLCMTAVPVSGATIYVRPDGDDEQSEPTAPERALRTITRAAQLAEAGDRVVVGPGTYREGNITPAAFGFVHFVADRRGEETGDGAGDVVVDATSFASGFELNRHLAGRIDGFVVYSAGNGIHVKSQSDQALISNNIVSSCRDNGILVQDSKNVTLFNNLLYDNAGSGALVGGSVSGSAGAYVLNNTVYGNQNRGIFFSGTTVGSPEGLVLNNVLQANGIAGIQVNESARDGYLAAGNVSADRWASGTPVDVTDQLTDPLLVDPVGADGRLGGPDYADDRFFLSHRKAGQTQTSPAIDAGSDRSRRFRLHGSSTRTDGRPDGRTVDSGYHYGNFSPAPSRWRVRQRLRTVPLFVSASSGDDGNEGSTARQALRTIRRALDLARPGHRIVLLADTYAEGELNVDVSGLPGREIVVQGEIGAVVDARGAGRAFLISGRSHLRLFRLDVRGASEAGVEIRNGSANIELHGSVLRDNDGIGLKAQDSTALSLRSSMVAANTSRGVQVGASDIEVHQSRVVANGAQGIWVNDDSRLTLTGSVLADNAKEGLLAGRSEVSAERTRMERNRSGGARVDPGSTAVLQEVHLSENVDAGLQVISGAVHLTDCVVQGNSGVGIDALIDPETRAAAEVSADSTTVCGNQGTAVRAVDALVNLADVTLCANSADGLRVTGGRAQVSGSTLADNAGEGLAASAADAVLLDGSTVAGNKGSGVRSHDVGELSISSSVVHSNGGDGITIMDSMAPRLWNNLVYLNSSTGVLISGTVSGSAGAQVESNTFYGNGNRGLLLGGSDLQPPSPGATVLRNIFQANQVAGVQVNRLSLPGYLGDFNLSVDAYGALTPIGFHDVLADPLFVRPSGADGVVGGAGAEDDNFRLSQRLAGETTTSPAVDAGGVDAGVAGLDKLSTRSDDEPDRGLADLGYHYPSTQ